MNTNLKSLMRQLLSSPKNFPVETALGVAFFIISVLDMEKVINTDICWLFVPLLTLSFWLRRVNRWAYFASFFLFMPLMAINLTPFLWTTGFFFTYALAAILLVVGSRKMDNRAFASHTLHVTTQLFFGLLISLTLMLAVLAIIASFLYIFGISKGKTYEYILLFIWLVTAPQICCTLISNDEDVVSEPAKILRLILNYILSPAIIIYTVILYTYFLKIAFEWDLPKGGVAWMVMGFISVALIGKMAQAVLSRRYFDWYYSHFTLIAIPPLILYWVGFLYRIRLYSFTEDRVYLLVAGILMTLFVLMLLHERTSRFQLMAIILGGAIILFTYIPGISAKHIGLRCQEQRIKNFISELKLSDIKTGKFSKDIDFDNIQKDSLLCERYQEACNVIRYVRRGMGEDKFNAQYGSWDFSESQFQYNSTYIPTTQHYPKYPIQLDNYNILLKEYDYQCTYNDHMITVRPWQKEGKNIIEYPIDSMVLANPKLLDNPEELLVYKNDSLMIVLPMIVLEGKKISFISSSNFQLYRKTIDR